MTARRKTYDLGNGFRIQAENRGNWTQYSAMQLRDDGLFVEDENGPRIFRSCYRREADIKITEWRSK